MDQKASRDKLLQIFSYLRELNKIKTPPASDLSNYSWMLDLDSLPTYPTIQKFNLEDPDNQNGGLRSLDWSRCG